MTIARHAGQTSKMKPRRAHANQRAFVVFLRNGLRRSGYCQARGPNLESETWKRPGLPKLVLSYFLREGLRRNDDCQAGTMKTRMAQARQMVLAYQKNNVNE